MEHIKFHSTITTAFFIYIRLLKGGREGRGNEGTPRDDCTRMRS